MGGIMVPSTLVLHSEKPVLRRFLSLSCDESTAVDGKGYMSIFVHAVNDLWECESHFLHMPEVRPLCNCASH